ncbi:MAG: AzlC family ABC transporter permease [Candidatus Pelethousia sp.]|nr:AzlC family ABC transporter permease [Candidatus Pelethousia sp.]
MHNARLRAFRFVCKRSVPILFEYIFLGIAFGILMNQAGYAPIWAMLSAAFIYAGAMQIVMVPLLSGGAPLWTIAAMTLFINARHIFYGIGFVERFKRMGPLKYAYMALTVTDETYSLLISPQYPADVEPMLGDFYTNLLAHCTWILGCTLGAVAGQVLPVDLTGIDFCATAFFITVVVSQWRQFPSRIPALAGLVSAAVFLVLLGPARFIIPALAVSMAALMMLRDRVELQMRGGQAHE